MKTLIFGYGITGKAVETFFKVKSKDYLIYDDNENVILDIKKELLFDESQICLLYTSPSPRDRTRSRMPSSA